jgi:alpha-tubulin suppressor-like RCC1 family protein
LFTTIDKNKTLVYAWGYNKHGQLGFGDDKDRSSPTLVEQTLDYNFKKVHCGYYHTALLEEGG